MRVKDSKIINSTDIFISWLILKYSLIKNITIKYYHKIKYSYLESRSQKLCFTNLQIYLKKHGYEIIILISFCIIFRIF